ncbi:hypothetical protein PHSY_002830 [Pseudozyma hubeiensis SY62]|uniref:Uncharacterized protein n=1 Tax=Pseudozyma hubeiensis (strain SY62) TaxID=1305764 RepID=R9PB05_PSEHS|nr:hypothetical protein PHSY_002830 [Pseudozyma hubeiensis SY62]GAC95255.1 hypothetical protein PHSY_002830 [Pseudozyma hubeiensis SY62]
MTWPLPRHTAKLASCGSRKNADIRISIRGHRQTREKKRDTLRHVEKEDSTILLYRNVDGSKDSIPDGSLRYPVRNDRDTSIADKPTSPFQSCEPDCRHLIAMECFDHPKTTISTTLIDQSTASASSASPEDGNATLNCGYGLFRCRFAISKAQFLPTTVISNAPPLSPPHESHSPLTTDPARSSSPPTFLPLLYPTLLSMDIIPYFFTYRPAQIDKRLSRFRTRAFKQ